MTHKFRGLALHTWTVDTTPLEGALAAARSGGFDAVELRRVDFMRCKERGLSNGAVLDIVRAGGLPVSAMGVEYGWIFSGGEERERLFGVFREACENAVALGCGMMMSAIGPGAGRASAAGKAIDGSCAVSPAIRARAARSRSNAKFGHRPGHSPRKP